MYFQFEKEKVEKQVKRLESERDSLNSELIQLKVEATKSQSTFDQAAQEKAKAEEKIQDLKEEMERLENMMAEVSECILVMLPDLMLYTVITCVWSIFDKKFITVVLVYIS